MDKQTKKNLLMYPLGTVGRDMMYALFNSYLLTYTMYTRSLTNAQLSAITIIMVAARVFDALNDPIMGNLIERTRTKYGKFMPFSTWLVAKVALASKSFSSVLLRQSGSPVRVDSSTASDTAVIRSPSAGTSSPVLITTTSPTTTSRRAMCVALPSRMTSTISSSFTWLRMVNSLSACSSK